MGQNSDLYAGVVDAFRRELKSVFVVLGIATVLGSALGQYRGEQRHIVFGKERQRPDIE